MLNYFNNYHRYNHCCNLITPNKTQVLCIKILDFSECLVFLKVEECRHYLIFEIYGNLIVSVCKHTTSQGAVDSHKVSSLIFFLFSFSSQKTILCCFILAGFVLE